MSGPGPIRSSYALTNDTTNRYSRKEAPRYFNGYFMACSNTLSSGLRGLHALLTETKYLQDTRS